MKSFIRVFFIGLLTASLFACSSQPQQAAQPQKPQRPAWIDNPQSVGQVVGLGQAGFHFNGQAAQRQLATSRALDEIARQMGVTVSNIMVVSQQYSNMSSSSKMASTSEQSVQGSVVNAVIHDEWKEGDTLYVIMVSQ